MCHAIVEIKYRAATQPDETIKMADAAMLENRVEQLKKNELIDRITVFTPTTVLTRVSSWHENARSS